MRNDQRLELLLLEAAHEIAWGRRLFVALGGQRIGRRRAVAIGHGLHALDEGVEVHVDAGVGRVGERGARWQTTRLRAQHLRDDTARRDRPCRDPAIVEIAEDHVLVAIVIGGRAADLRPLETDV